MKSFIVLGWALLSYSCVFAQHTDGPYPAWFGSVLPGVSSGTSAAAGPSSGNAATTNTGTGDTGPSRLPGKLGGYYYGGGGGPCEAGCESRKPVQKPVRPSAPTAQELAEEKRRQRDAALTAYFNDAKQVFEVYGAYKTAHGIEIAINKVMVEWVGTLASRACFTLYLLVRDGGIGAEPLEEMQKQRIEALQKKLKENQKIERETPQSKTPASNLPVNFRGPAFDPNADTKEIDTRRRYLKDKTLNKSQAKEAVKSFLRKDQGPLLGDLVATIMEVYDADKIEREGLSDADQSWLVEFNAAVGQAQREKINAMGANTCDIPSDKKFCNIAGGPVGASCYCNSAPGKQGFSAARPTGTVCETPSQACEMPYSAPFGTGCFCASSNGAERGVIKW